MSTDSGPPNGPDTAESPSEDDFHNGNLIDLPIEDELKSSYLTYAMSVIVSRALPDVRDGLKPSQRRILVAMNDLNLGPGSSRVKCAKISGDTSGNYHPHGESVIYPTLVRMAQEWNMRHVLIDKQGNFGSIAGLPPAAMRYTEARLSAISSLMLDDLKLDTVDYTPTYDQSRMEPTVLPSKFPNLLVNGANGIAVGMATSIPPHNLAEVCNGLIQIIDSPETSIDELMEIIPGPDFPTGGIICGRSGIRQGYHTGRSTVVVRARADIIEDKKGRFKIIVKEVPYQHYRDRVIKSIAGLVNSGRIPGISDIRDISDLEDPVRLEIDLKRDADPDVVLNQLYKFSPLQDTVSIILLSLVGGKPRTLNIKQMLEEFLRHREAVIRRRTQHLLAKSRQRKHVVEGQLLALANIDEIIKIIRQSSTQAEAKTSLMGVECAAAMMREALGDDGFNHFQLEHGEADTYSLTAVQADAILRMTLGQLVNLEQEKLGTEHGELLAEISEYLHILEDRKFILEIVKQEVREIRDKFGDDRLTEISGQEIGSVNLDDLITEESMAVTISHNGYIKRTPLSVYRAQRRGGKGLKGARADEEDPIEHLFVASTHAHLLFFTNRGKVYWQKVYDIPALGRSSKGRAVVNLLQLDKDEQILDCIAIRDFDLSEHYLMMATRSGLVKKTDLSAYSRPKRGGIKAIKLREKDELVDVVLTQAGDEILMSTAQGMAIRFPASDARPMGRDTSGVKGISLATGDQLVGMVVTDPDATLLTICEKGYGKRTLFGPHLEDAVAESGDGNSRYRTQKRGGKGLRDIRTSDRNGQVVDIVQVKDDDEVLMMTRLGQIQRTPVEGISTIGRNTQGVRIMRLADDDLLAAVVRVPSDDVGDNGNGETEDAVDAEVADDDPDKEV